MSSLNVCIEEVRTWLANNMLQLNGTHRFSIKPRITISMLNTATSKSSRLLQMQLSVFCHRRSTIESYCVKYCQELLHTDVHLYCHLCHVQLVALLILQLFLLKFRQLLAAFIGTKAVAKNGVTIYYEND